MTPEIETLVEFADDWMQHTHKSCLELPAGEDSCYCGLTLARRDRDAALHRQALELTAVRADRQDLANRRGEFVEKLYAQEREIAGLKKMKAACEETLVISCKKLVEVIRERNALQARVDELMLEYCPDEMTPEQRANWAAHQVPVSAEEQANIEAAVRE